MKKLFIIFSLTIALASCDNVKEAAGVVDADDYSNVCYQLEKAEKRIKELESEVSDLESKNSDLSNLLNRYKNDDATAINQLHDLKRDLSWGSIDDMDELNRRINVIINTLQ